MKKISLNLLTNLMLLLSGVLLIIFFKSPDLMDWVARIMGVMFVLPSIAYLISVTFRREHSTLGNDYLGVLPAVGGLCFGVIMFVRPQSFAEVLCMFMGGLLFVLGLFHVVYMLLSRREMDVKGGYFVFPLLLVAAGLIILLVDSVRECYDAVVLATGIGLLLFNITSLQEHRAELRMRRNAPSLPRIDDDGTDPTVPVSPSADDSGQSCTTDSEIDRNLHVEL